MFEIILPTNDTLIMYTYLTSIDSIEGKNYNMWIHTTQSCDISTCNDCQKEVLTKFYDNTTLLISITLPPMTKQNAVSDLYY